MKNKLKYGVHYTDSDYVCVKESGSINTLNVFKYNTSKMKGELGINFHSFRHTHATMLMENGAKVKDIQARLDHSRSAITIDTYSHLTQNMQIVILQDLILVHLQYCHEGFLRYVN